MLRRVAPRWRGGLSLGLGLPLLLGSTPAAAAGSFGVGGLTTSIGVVAALWAVLGARALPSEAGGFAIAAIGVVAGGVAAWRYQRSRSERSTAVTPMRNIAVRETPIAIPAGLNGEAVLDAARGRFIRLQAAWDASDISTLKSLTTPDMLEELLHVLTARGGAGSRTDVITLHAELLGLEELSAAYLASVEFSGLIRESADRGAVPFRELWMLACMKDGAPSWRLARQQSLF
ncbi:MAG: Tim44-like domain-containing protein [Pseudomonadota bacterium]|nr:Tim44-like domain-containing protein [Pseudomonadota bacterium]